MRITQCTVCKNYTHACFHAQLKLFLLVPLLQQFQYILQLICQPIFSCTYSFHSLASHNLSHAAFTCFNTKRKKHRFIPICGLILHSWLFIEIQLNKFTLVKVDENVNPVKEHLLINPNILCHSFSLTSCECLKYQQLQ